jgi:hypothetical protein
MGNCNSEEHELTEYEEFEQQTKNPKRIFISKKENKYVLMGRKKRKNGYYYMFYLLGEESSPVFFHEDIGGLGISNGEPAYNNKIVMKHTKPNELSPVRVEGYSYHSYWIPFAFKRERLFVNHRFRESMNDQQAFVLKQIEGDCIRLKI